MKYNIKPTELEEELNIEDQVIEKHGHVIEFTMSDVDANIRHNTKTQTELSAKLELDTAKQENIENFHPFVKEMSEEDLFTAWMYKDQQNTIDMIQAKLEEVTTQIESDKAEVEVIKSQIPELNNIESPYDSEETGTDKE